VGHTLAYVMAVEQALGVPVPGGALVVRALLLECERLYNHVNDIGAIVNDVGYGIVHAHTQRLREHLLRHNKHLTGHRLLRGGITVGDAALAGAPDLELVAATARQLAEIVEVALGNHVVRDRLTGTAVLDHEQAGLLDTLGYVARASSRAVDGRADHPFVDLPGFTPVVETGGDVLARLLVRAREAAASAALITDLTARLDEGSSDAAPVPEPAEASGPGGAPAPGHGLGIVEAWRGLLVHRVEVGPDGRLTRVKVVDPSFVNWPALPVALTDVIVPDFPLANKSFNQSYAGNDL
jgi:Ni,Fe-hydrogenase III large subunit